MRWCFRREPDTSTLAEMVAMLSGAFTTITQMPITYGMTL
jgi:hypothetical protein